MKRHIAMMAALLAGALGAAAQDTVRMTLDSCLRYAHQHNLKAQTAVLNAENAKVSFDGARMRFLPSISATASHSLGWDDQTTRSTSAGVSSNLTLFSGLNNLRTYQQSKLGARQSELKIRQVENAVDVQVISAYLTILMNREKLSYQQEVLETSWQQMQEGELKYQVGRLLESDYRLLQANYLTAQTEIDNTRLTIEDNQQELTQLLGRFDGVVVDVVPSTDTLKAGQHEVRPIDSVLAQARREMPDWEIVEMDVELARLGVRIAESAFLPTVNLNAGANYNDGEIVSTNPATAINGGLNTTVGVGVSVPLLNRGTSLTQLRQSKIALREAELQHRQTLKDLVSEIETMHLNLRQAMNRFLATERMAEAYRASYEVYAVKYGLGAVTTVEMLQQQERYLTALNDYLQSKYSYLTIEKQLDIYTGKNITL